MGVLYFYPRADTPGCTIEAASSATPQEDRRVEPWFLASRRTHPTRRKNSRKIRSAFTLLGDADKKICNLYDVIKEKNMYGKKVMGVVRTTFIIVRMAGSSTSSTK